MTRAQMIALASPPCGTCGGAVQRLEFRWHCDEDGAWRFVASTVCADAHRVIVEPLTD